MVTYFIQEGFGGRVKIGRSSNRAESRAIAGQTFNSRPLHVLAEIDGDKERHYHETFREERIGSSEWFQPSDRLMGFVASLPGYKANVHVPEVETDKNKNAYAPEVDGELISLSEATRIIPPRDSGPISSVSVWRWCVRGQNGIYLRHVRVGRRTFTTKRWLLEYGAALAEARMLIRGVAFNFPARKIVSKDNQGRGRSLSPITRERGQERKQKRCDAQILRDNRAEMVMDAAGISVGGGRAARIGRSECQKPRRGLQNIT